ncbi:MAG: hypothetical protein DRP30_01530 [Thermotoga sp.]|nr:MAG: hypothetical protein DRP30_01530 [Thermotoga sp.]
MKKIYLVLFVFILASVGYFAQAMTVSGDIGYSVGLKTGLTQDGTAVATSVSLSFVEGGVTFGYEVVDNLTVGARIGIAYAPIQSTDIQTIYGTSTANTFMPLDIMVVASYKYAFDGFGIGVNAGGGLSTPDFFGNFGWMVRTTLEGFYSFNDFSLSLGAGVEMRNYTVGTGRNLDFIGLPIVLRFNYSF